ncbi:MAG: diacylglycerol kinase family protein [bacterium]|nr:diacylglycerol kinase family protein [bacterium]
MVDTQAPQTEPVNETGQESPDGHVSEEAEKRNVLVTPDGEELDMSIVGTMKIDPGNYGGSTKNPNRLASLKYGIAGLLYLLKREQSIQIASAATIITLGIGLWLGVSSFYWAILALALGAIWITEALNTAIEAAIDLETTEIHPMAKVGKDVASAASLISSIVFVIVVLLMLVPRILDRLTG